MPAKGFTSLPHGLSEWLPGLFLRPRSIPTDPAATLPSQDLDGGSKGVCSRWTCGYSFLTGFLSSRRQPAGAVRSDFSFVPDPGRTVGAGSVGVGRGRRKSPGSYSERPWGRLVNPLAGNPSSGLVVITLDSDSKGPWIEPRLRHFPQSEPDTWRSYPDLAQKKKSDLKAPAG